MHVKNRHEKKGSFIRAPNRVILNRADIFHGNLLMSFLMNENNFHLTFLSWSFSATKLHSFSTPFSAFPIERLAKRHKKCDDQKFYLWKLLLDWYMTNHKRHRESKLRAVSVFIESFHCSIKIFLTSSVFFFEDKWRSAHEVIVLLLLDFFDCTFTCLS